MRLIRRHIMREFAFLFGMSILVVTFVMSLGALVKAIDWMARGITGVLLAQFFALNIPFLLMFTIPVSMLTAVLLLFGRLSAEGELIGLRASGVSLGQLSRHLLLFGFLMSLICLYIAAYLAPAAKFQRRQLLHTVSAEDPLSVLEEGNFIDYFPGYKIRVEEKEGHKLHDITVYEMRRHGVGIARDVQAKSGRVTNLTDQGVLKIDLYDVRIENMKNEGNTPLDSQHIKAEHYPVTLDISKMLEEETRELRELSDTPLPRLIERIQTVDRRYTDRDASFRERQRMSLLVEINKRISLSASCIGFTLLGIPLGIQSRRRQSWAGVGTGIGVLFGYYLFIILAEALTEAPHLRPDLLLWIPVMGILLPGAFLLWRFR